MGDPSDTCPICGGHDVVGAHSKPSKAGEWLWACRQCAKCWERGEWYAVMDRPEVEKP